MLDIGVCLPSNRKKKTNRFCHTGGTVKKAFKKHKTQQKLVSKLNRRLLSRQCVNRRSWRPKRKKYNKI